jgi:hypothetical protein
VSVAQSVKQICRPPSLKIVHEMKKGSTDKTEAPKGSIEAQQTTTLLCERQASCCMLGIITTNAVRETSYSTSASTLARQSTGQLATRSSGTSRKTRTGYLPSSRRSQISFRHAADTDRFAPSWKYLLLSRCIAKNMIQPSLPR